MSGGLGAPPLPDVVPRRGNAISYFVGRTMMRIGGWRFDNGFPAVSKAVLVVAPHTSNWDFLVGLSGMLALGLRLRMLAKHTLFWEPFASFLRWLGGIPVDRSRPKSVVEQVTAEFRRAESMLLALAPEGTRRKVSDWKSGFHRFALAGGAEIVPIYFDYPRRRIGFPPPITPTDDYDADLARVKACFRREMACQPENYWD